MYCNWQYWCNILNISKRYNLQISMHIAFEYFWLFSSFINTFRHNTRTLNTHDINMERMKQNEQKKNFVQNSEKQKQRDRKRLKCIKGGNFTNDLSVCARWMVIPLSSNLNSTWKPRMCFLGSYPLSLDEGVLIFTITADEVVLMLSCTVYLDAGTVPNVGTSLRPIQIRSNRSDTVLEDLTE